MTKRVILLVTGKCELKGLHRALRRAFADAVDVEFETRDLFNSFTSEKIDVNALAARPAGDERGPVEKLAMALIDAGLERRCDLALAVDDLELVNRGRDQEVRAFFRDAVEREIQRLELTNSARERVAQRCSFHLLVPMVEAYFFGEADAITRATSDAGIHGVPTWSTSGPTLEAFATTDSTFLNRVVHPDISPSHAGYNKTTAWRSHDREVHPKRYMEFLCRSASVGYREGSAGVAALANLDFHQVLTGGAQTLHEMLGDIEEALEISCPVFPPTTAPRSAGLLRNL